jgi:hypothetical protein
MESDSFFGVAMESDSFFMGCYGNWQFLKGLLWKVTVSLGVLKNLE